jgi:hypothetical protein
MDKEVMVCSECGLIDDTWTAYCSRHARSPHILIDITDIEKRVRKQTLEEVLKDLKRTKKIIETYIKPLSEYERGRYEHAWNMILELEQKLRETK